MDSGSCVPSGDHENQIIELWNFERHKDNPPVRRMQCQSNDHAVGGLDEATPKSSFEHFVRSEELIPVPYSEYVHAQAQDTALIEFGLCELAAATAVICQQQCDVVPCATGSKPRKGARKRERDKNWTDEETAILVECKRTAFHDKGSPFRKPKSKGSNWDAISHELRNNPVTRASEKTGDQCRLRWDTLVKSHRVIKQQCMKKSKGYVELTEEELSELKLATSLNKDWFDVIDSISREAKSRKGGGILSCSVGNFANPERRVENIPTAKLVILRNTPTDPGSHQLLQERVSPVSAHSSPACGPPIQDPTGRLERREASRKRISIPGFSSMDVKPRATLLDLILGARFLKGRLFDAEESCEEDETLSLSCRWLSIVQNRSCSEIYNDVNKLVKMKLVHISVCTGVLAFYDVCINQARLRVFEKYVKKVILHHPVYNTHMRIGDQTMSKLEASSLPRQIRVLKVEGCAELKTANFRGLRNLRSLSICKCPKLAEVTGWKFLRELGWLEICSCPSFRDYPDLRYHPSLREYRFIHECSREFCPRICELDMSQCVRLRRLEIWNDDGLEECWDLSSLRCLETLSFDGCVALSSISGLSGLHLLTSLNLQFCWTLKSLPDIGHMKELVCLDIGWSGLEEIRGVEKLVSLKQLVCSGSDLKGLPDLHHLPYLGMVLLEHTPLVEDDPSSFYFDKDEVEFNRKERKHVDVSDISDTEYILSDHDVSFIDD